MSCPPRLSPVLLLATTATAGLSQLPPVVDLGDLDGQGIEHRPLEGSVPNAFVGSRVVDAGDLNGDGFQDLAIAAADSFQAGGKAGALYVVFGGPMLDAASPLDLDGLDGVDGFRILGSGALAQLATGVSAVGDLNADGLVDLAIGDHSGAGGSGSVHVLFGAPDIGAGGSVDLGSLDGSNGVRFDGFRPGGNVGSSVAGLGDFNQDGHADMAIGAWKAYGLETFVDQPGDLRLDGGDVDGDGDQDLVAVNEQARVITSFLNDGAGGFSIGQSLTLVQLEPQGGALEDIDRDGDLDLVYTGRWSSGVLRVVRNPGDGDFSGAPEEYPLADCWMPMVVTDVDTDGYPDVVVGSWDSPGCSGGGSAQLQAFLNDGTGKLSPPVDTPLPAGGPWQIDAADVDGDSDPDLLLRVDTHPANNDDLEVWINQGAGLFTQGTVLSPGIGFVEAAILLDVDNDGDGDIVAGVGQETWIYRSDGLGTFGAPEKHANLFGLRRLSGADLDGDGFVDLVGYSNDEVRIQRNLAGQGFTSGMRYRLTGDVIEVRALDLDGDGLPGVVAGLQFSGELAVLPNLGHGYLGGQWRGEAYVVFGGPGVGASGQVSLSGLDGSDGFVVPGPMANSRFGVDCVGTGDLNGDGVPDLAVSAYDAHGADASTGAVYVLFGGAGVGASGSVDLPSLDGSNGFRILGPQPGGIMGRSIAAGDVDGDGLGDLVIGAHRYDVGGLEDAGAAFVVLGSPGLGAGGLFDLEGLDGTIGHRLPGFASEQEVGRRVACGGDFDGDGADEVLVHAAIDPAWEGRAFLVFGGATLAGVAEVDLAALDGTDGVTFLGAAPGDFAGEGLGVVGDVDSDGAVDLLLTAPWADPGGVNNAGTGYLLFGPASPCTSSIGQPYCPAVPSSRGAGARLVARGSDVVVDDCLTLFALGLPFEQFGYFLAADAPDFVTHPGGSQGNLCLGGNIGRFADQVQSSGRTGWIAIDVDMAMVPQLGAIGPGETWYFQAWFRDKNPQTTSNFTAAVELLFL